MVPVAVPPVAVAETVEHSAQALRVKETPALLRAAPGIPVAVAAPVARGLITQDVVA